MPNPFKHRSTLQDMLATIEKTAVSTAGYTGRARFSDRVMAAMGTVPREAFIPESARELAHMDGPLSIGYGQTISQPYIVALMTDVLDLDRDAVVLDVGTGCGYQAAILASIAAQVYGIELVPKLAEETSVRLQCLGYTNVSVQCADGYYGWPEHAPYDGILIAATASEIPPPLIEQLKPGGRLIAPLAHGHRRQELTLVQKRTNGQLEQKDILPVSFVPFIHEKP